MPENVLPYSEDPRRRAKARFSAPEAPSGARFPTRAEFRTSAFGDVSVTGGPYDVVGRALSRAGSSHRARSPCRASLPPAGP
jgi:hypothetical protein